MCFIGVQKGKIERKFPARTQLCTTQDINGLAVCCCSNLNRSIWFMQVLITRYIHPQAPPPELVVATDS